MRVTGDDRNPPWRRALSAEPLPVAPARGAGSFATMARRSRRRRAALRTPSGSGSESGASLSASSALAQLQQLVISLANRMSGAEERLSRLSPPGLAATFPALPAFPVADGAKIGVAPVLFSLFENDDAKDADITFGMLETRLLEQAESSREQLETCLLE